VCTGEVSSPRRHSGESRNPGTDTRLNRMDSGFRRNDRQLYGRPFFIMRKRTMAVALSEASVQGQTQGLPLHTFSSYGT
jgi:hypothetical protein